MADRGYTKLNFKLCHPNIYFILRSRYLCTAVSTKKCDSSRSLPLIKAGRRDTTAKG